MQTQKPNTKPHKKKKSGGKHSKVNIITIAGIDENGNKFINKQQLEKVCANIPKARIAQEKKFQKKQEVRQNNTTLFIRDAFEKLRGGQVHKFYKI